MHGKTSSFFAKTYLRRQSPRHQIFTELSPLRMGQAIMHFGTSSGIPLALGVIITATEWIQVVQNFEVLFYWYLGFLSWKCIICFEGKVGTWMIYVDDLWSHFCALFCGSVLFYRFLSTPKRSPRSRRGKPPARIWKSKSHLKDMRNHRTNM